MSLERRNGGGLGGALRGEFFRLRRSRATLALVIIPAIVAIGHVFSARATVATRQGEEAAASVEVQSDPAVWTTLDNAYGPFIDAYRLALAIGVMVVITASCGLVASERDSGTIRVSLTRCISRTHMIMAKAVTALTMAALVFVSSGITALAASALLFDFGPYVEDGVQLYEVSEVHREVAKALGLAAPSLIATSFFGLAISSVSRGAGQAIALGLGSYVSFDLFKGLLGPLQRWAFPCFNPSVNDDSYFRLAERFARGFFEDTWTAERVWTAVIAPLPQAALFLIVAWASTRWRRL